MLSDLADLFKTHRVEQLGFPGAVKCHACDDWTEGTIHDHHADLARAFFAAERERDRAVAAVRALAEEWERQAEDPDDPAYKIGLFSAAAEVRAALSAEPTTGGAS